jgi:hypothetical protein
MKHTYGKSNKKRKRYRKNSSKNILLNSLVLTLTKNAYKRKRFRIFSFFCLVTFIFILALISIIYAFIQTEQEFAANFADDLMRPVVGSQATIMFEAVFFYLQDHIDQISYSPPKNLIHVLSKTTFISPADISVKEEFPLDRIPTQATGSALTGEGIWEPIKIGTQEAFMAKTVYRPDPNRLYAMVSLVKMNMQKLGVSSIAGFKEPGGAQHPETGKVPEAIQKSKSADCCIQWRIQEKRRVIWYDCCRYNVSSA